MEHDIMARKASLSPHARKLNEKKKTMKLVMKNIASLFIDENYNEKFSSVISVENSKGIKKLKKNHRYF